MDPECILESVVPFSSGARMLRPGDRIVSVNGIEVFHFNDFVSLCYPDDSDETEASTVTLGVHRASEVIRQMCACEHTHILIDAHHPSRRRLRHL